MAYKDTLKLFDELRAAGVQEAAARAQAEQLGAVTHVIEDLKNEFKIGFQKLDRDMLWMRIIGAGMIATFLANLWR